MRGWSISLLALVALAGGCDKDKQATVSPVAAICDPCDPSCGVGECENYSPDTVISEHSQNAGTFAEAFGVCPYEPEEVPPIASFANADSDIPKFNRRRSRLTNYTRGDKSYHDIELHEHLMGVHAQVLRCLDVAACYTDDADFESGDLDFQFELASDGRVRAVSVKTTDNLAEPVVISCARRSMYDYEFPKYNGGSMMISYTVTLD